MPTCDLFEVNITGLEPDTVDYLVYTDLPAGTRVLVTCQRSFVNLKSERRLWIGYDEALVIQPSIYGDFNGLRGRIDVVQSDRRALERFRNIDASWSSGIGSKVSDEVEIVFTVGARQRLRDYGRNNENLSGQMVSRSGDLKIVESRAAVIVPMHSELQPLVE